MLKPEFTHGSAPRTAVLLVNLGTPDAPTAPALRRYLAEFLADPRVVEIPKVLWMLILHGIILRVRPAKSAAKYASIWRGEQTNPLGSPLKFFTEQQSKGLQEALDATHPKVSDALGQNLIVRYAMRYGNPSIPAVLDELKAAGATRVLVLPLYPQYAAATTATAVDAVGQWLAKQRWQPEVRYVNHYHDDAGYVAALAASVRAHWRGLESAGKQRGQILVMSFHGVPERSLHLGDPYHCECYKTARLLAESLGLSKEQYRVTFQSRFGRAKWLQPYTQDSVEKMAQAGIERVDVICPGFAADCLETLEEIQFEVKEAFEQHGGKQFEYIACLNDNGQWLGALRDIALQHLGGWTTTQPVGVASAERELNLSRVAALQAGATN